MIALKNVDLVDLELYKQIRSVAKTHMETTAQKLGEFFLICTQDKVAVAREEVKSKIFSDQSAKVHVETFLEEGAKKNYVLVLVVSNTRTVLPALVTMGDSPSERL